MITHLYQADLTTPADQRGERACQHCPLPRLNRVHQVPDRTEANQEHRRRAGEGGAR